MVDWNILSIGVILFKFIRKQYRFQIKSETNNRLLLPIPIHIYIYIYVSMLRRDFLIIMPADFSTKIITRNIYIYVCVCDDLQAEHKKLSVLAHMSHYWIQYADFLWTAWKTDDNDDIWRPGMNTFRVISMNVQFFLDVKSIECALDTFSIHWYTDLLTLLDTLTHWYTDPIRYTDSILLSVLLVHDY